MPRPFSTPPLDPEVSFLEVSPPRKPMHGTASRRNHTDTWHRPPGVKLVSNVMCIFAGRPPICRRERLPDGSKRTWAPTACRNGHTTNIKTRGKTKIRRHTRLPIYIDKQTRPTNLMLWLGVSDDTEVQTEAPLRPTSALSQASAACILCSPAGRAGKNKRYTGQAGKDKAVSKSCCRQSTRKTSLWAQGGVSHDLEIVGVAL